MSRKHGTRVRYVKGPDERGIAGSGCRCGRCAAANRVAENHRTRMQSYGCWQPYVDAGPAREHVRMLSQSGIGWKRAAQLAGISTGGMSKLMYGGPGSRPPSRRIRSQTEDAILAVQPDPGNLGSGAPVDATATRRRLQALVAIGWAKAQLAARLGMNPGNFGAVMERGQVAAGTDRAVAGLYDELWNQLPPETGHRKKISASRARNYARARGWALPQQWDDDTIGDPEAVPAERRQDSKRRPSAETAAEAAELFRFGLDRNQAAERLGMNKHTLDTVLARAQRPADGKVA